MAELVEMNSGNVERSKLIPANLLCLIVQSVEGSESAKWWMGEWGIGDESAKVGHWHLAFGTLQT
jgi:hypothetical protein